MRWRYGGGSVRVRLGHGARKKRHADRQARFVSITREEEEHVVSSGPAHTRAGKSSSAQQRGKQPQTGRAGLQATLAQVCPSLFLFLFVDFQNHLKRFEIPNQTK
jgi:hypothetical protein